MAVSSPTPGISAIARQLDCCSYRTKVLDVYLFTSLDEGREITWRWMLEYYEERAHGALGKLIPIEFYQQAGTSTFELST